MATRPVFMVKTRPPFCDVEGVSIEFKYYSGFAESQKRKSIDSLHAAFSEIYPEVPILEVSTKSPAPAGQLLSAFNLQLLYKNGERHYLENVFQSSKIFDLGGPYTDLLYKTPIEAKKDPRIHESGNVTGFRIGKVDFPIQPETFFYDWLYISAVHQHPELAEELLKYSAFTDIEFNPKKSLNCQARSAALYVSLERAGKLETAIHDRQAFMDMAYFIA